MIGLLARRIVSAAAVLFLALSATFLLLHSAPGDPTALLDDPRVPEGQRQRLREVWGLDEPLPVRYATWLGNALRGEWGDSFASGRPAEEVMLDVLPNTILLGGLALLVALATSIPLGVAAARRRDRALDHALRIGSLLLYSVPTFWLGLVALLLFAHGLGFFPSSHMRSVGTGPVGGWAGLVDVLHHAALPALVLGLSTAGGLLRFARTSWLETAGEPFLHSARARGIPEWRIQWVHGARAGLGPFLQVLAVTVPGLFGGALVTEVIFSWPGLGRLTYDSLLSRDYPLALAAAAWSAGLVVLSTLAADLLHAAADPRVRPDA